MRWVCRLGDRGRGLRYVEDEMKRLVESCANASARSKLLGS